jgi:hypothetical protein
MRDGIKSKVLALAACALVGATLAPGCDQLGLGSDGGGGAGGGEQAFAAVDAQELASASLKASALSYYLAGLIASSGTDPSTLDQATLNDLVQQNAAAAEAEVDSWLATIDPSTVALAGADPKYECTEDFKCPYRTKCSNDPYRGLTHVCFVVDCGSARCSTCPNWFPDFIKELVLKAWCAYVCIESGVSYPKVVAVGAGGVTAFGNPYPADGPYCFAP